MYLASTHFCSFTQRLSIKRVVLLLKEHRLPVYAARYDMLWGITGTVTFSHYHCSWGNQSHSHCPLDSGPSHL